MVPITLGRREFPLHTNLVLNLELCSQIKISVIKCDIDVT